MNLEGFDPVASYPFPHLILTNRQPPLGLKAGSQRWVPTLGPKAGSQSWVPKLGPKVRSQSWVPKLGPKAGSQRWVPKRMRKAAGSIPSGGSPSAYESCESPWRQPLRLCIL